MFVTSLLEIYLDMYKLDIQNNVFYRSINFKVCTYKIIDTHSKNLFVSDMLMIA